MINMSFRDKIPLSHDFTLSCDPVALPLGVTQDSGLIWYNQTGMFNFVKVFFAEASAIFTQLQQFLCLLNFTRLWCASPQLSLLGS